MISTVSGFGWRYGLHDINAMAIAAILHHEHRAGVRMCSELVTGISSDNPELRM